ncbi:MAG: hemolysin family protein [Lachnospiraceae bacterium]
MDSDTGSIIGAVVLAALLLIDFIMTSFAAAVDAASDAELEEAFEEAGRPSGAILQVKSHMGMLSHTIWLLHVVICTGAGAVCIHFVRGRVQWAVLALLMVLVYLAGYSLPEMSGRKNPTRTVVRRYAFAHKVMTVLRPFTYVMTVLSNLCIRLFGIDPQSLEQEVTEDEIITMVNEGHEQGVFNASEAEMIQNIFELDDKKAGDIMTHRKNIIALSGAMNLHDAISFMVGESVSRFPVYEDSVDNILGVIHFRDAMKFHTMGTYDDWLIRDISGLVRSVRYIPQTRGIDVLFRNMQAEKLQMVIVVDEYGQTAGLVTMEDILEEIVGNIQDEYDNELPLIHEESQGTYLMDGMAPLDEVTQTLGFLLEEADQDYGTLNGLLISRLDRIPTDGEQAEVVAYGYLFQIMSVKNKMICSVRITKYKEEE